MTAALSSVQTRAANVSLFAVTRILIITPLLLGTWGDQYGLSGQQIGTLASIELGCLGIASFTSGLWIGRVSPRKLFSILLPLIALGDVLSFYLGGIDSLFVLRALLGLMAGAIAACATAILARSNNPTKQYGLNVGAQFVYGFLLFLIMPALIQSYGVLPLAIAMALTTLVATVFGLQAPTTPLAQTMQPTGPRSVPLKALLILAATAVFFVVQLGIWTFIERIGLAAGLTAVPVGQALALSSLLGAPFALLAGQIEQKLGPPLAIASGVLAELAGLLLVLNSPTFFLFAVGLSLFSIGWAIMPPLLFGLLSRVTSDNAITGMLPAAQTAGMALGPGLLAMLIVPGDFSKMIVAGIALLLIFACVIVPVTRSQSA